ncbi:MAG TPA: hypothetical protein VHU82_10470 [Vicinamibacterales bacterium]|nr:hypothetical protein [Vicinamibacterales bacterium]
MRITFGRSALVALTLAAIGAAPARAADVLYVKAAHLIVDASQPAISPGTLVITDGVVTAAGASVAMPPGARQLDLVGLTVMPSLLDAHTHLAGGAPKPQPGQPMPLATPAYAALQAQKSVGAALQLASPRCACSARMIFSTCRSRTRSTMA